MDEIQTDEIPLFPLPNVVLFPGARLALRIFEPRYREMVTDARSGPGLVGMTVLRGDWQQDYEGCPEIYPLGCVGRIIDFEPLPDGRSNLVLLGLQRFCIRDELQGRVYRRASVDWLEEPGEAPEQSMIDGLREAVELLLRLNPENAAADLWAALPTDPRRMIDQLAFLLPLSPLEKFALLECSGASARASRMIEIVEFRIAEARVPREGRGPCH